MVPHLFIAQNQYIYQFPSQVARDCHVVWGWRSERGLSRWVGNWRGTLGQNRYVEGDIFSKISCKLTSGYENHGPYPIASRRILLSSYKGKYQFEIDQSYTFCVWEKKLENSKCKILIHQTKQEASTSTRRQVLVTNSHTGNNDMSIELYLRLQILH